MLNSLLQIGEQLYHSENYGPNYLIFEEAKLDNQKEQHHILEILINCDTKEIIVEKSLLKGFYEHAHIKLKNLKTLGGNNKKIYVTASFDKIKQIAISFWGKNFDGKSQLLEEINKVAPDLNNSIFVNAIKCISNFSEFASVFDKKIINEEINLSNNEEIVLVTVAIINSELGITQPVNLGALEGYSEFLEKRLLSTEGGEKRINYVNGSFAENVDTPKFLSRYNLNFLFVTTTINYLNNFLEENANKNYQIDIESKLYLEIASKYILNNLRTTIAGLQTVIVPRFLPKTKIDFLSLEPKISSKIDIAFSYKDFSANIVGNIDDEVDEDIFWVNFITFDSDGNSFKVINEITDVPYFRFLSIIEAFKEAGNQLSNYNKRLRNFNLYGFYKSIPVNKSKSNSKNINKAFLLIQNILEKRKINVSDLFESFSELVRAYYFKRTDAYSNIGDFDSDNFDYKAFDSVLKYLTIFRALMKLGILDKHNFNKIKEATMLNESSTDFGDKVEEFFKRTGYSNSQKALFYLGRMLNTIAYQQTVKGHKSKPILNKLNFNGMDKKEIIALQYDLFEKARQYGVVDKIEFDNARFTDYFDYNNWNTKPEESLFFILSGYSFGLSVANKKAENSENKEEQENNDEQQLLNNKEN